MRLRVKVLVLGALLVAILFILTFVSTTHRDSVFVQNTSRGLLRTTAGEISYLTVKHIDLLLGCMTNTGAFALRMSPSRISGKLRLLVGSTRCGRSFEIVDSDSVVNSDQAPRNGIAPKISSAADLSATNIQFTIIPRYVKGTSRVDGELLLLEANGLKKTFPFGDFMLCGQTSAANYPICVAIKEKIAPKTMEKLGPVSAIVGDVSSMELLGEIPLPMDLPRGYPMFVLDPTTDSLAIIDMDLNWLIVCDLSQLTGPNRGKPPK